MAGVHIASDVVVGANAVVTKNVEMDCVTVAGVPAAIISHIGLKGRNII